MSDLPARLRASDGFKVFTAGDGGRALAVDTDLMNEAADRIEQLETALRSISRNGCETFVATSTCRSDPLRTPESQYSSTRWCDACIAIAALNDEVQP